MKIEPNIVLGGGHGTQALQSIPDAHFFVGSWDDGKNTGLLRLLYPDVPPVGDIRSVLVWHIEKKFPDIAKMLSLRSSNSLFNKSIITKINLQLGGLEGIESFLEDHLEKKLEYIIKNDHATMPEDCVGNLVCVYLYTQGGIAALTQWASGFLLAPVELDTIFEEPTYLYGTYWDEKHMRTRLLDSETLIDNHPSTITNLYALDTQGQPPHINPILLNLLIACSPLWLAPGSRENYLPFFAWAKETNFAIQSPVNLVLPIFRTKKDVRLPELITSLDPCKLTVITPSSASIQQVLANQELLVSYAVEGKILEGAYGESRELFEKAVREWKQQDTELSRLLVKIYEKELSESQLFGGNCIASAELIELEDGWKTSPVSLAHLAQQM